MEREGERGFQCEADIHEVVNGHAADAPDPGFYVSEADGQVLADAILGDLAGDVHIEKVAGGYLDVLASHE